jgi:uncharacterized protein
LKIVIDADCIVAGALAPSGAASRLLDLWHDGEFEVITCPQLVKEVREALLRPRIANRYGITQQEVEELVGRLQQESIWVPDPVDPPRVVPEDPGDDYLVALALGNDADALVRRDRHFDGLTVGGLRILYPGEFLEEITG